jgi:ubiquinone/menaquinone biosynthesis C-methylase UbiE
MTTIFDILTDQYDAWYDSKKGKSLYESELLCIKPLVKTSPSPVLEVGVGTGRFARHFPNVIGVDLAVNALKLAKTRGIKTVQANGENLPFKDGLFGCILLIVTLCFAENPVGILTEAKRVLRRDGRIIIGLVPKDSPWGAFYERKKSEGHPFYSGAKFYSLKELKGLLQRAGLIISKINSTLLKGPDEIPGVEMPEEGYIREAGFLCIRAEPS